MKCDWRIINNILHTTIYSSLYLYNVLKLADPDQSNYLCRIDTSGTPYFIYTFVINTIATRRLQFELKSIDSNKPLRFPLQFRKSWTRGWQGSSFPIITSSSVSPIDDILFKRDPKNRISLGWYCSGRGVGRRKEKLFIEYQRHDDCDRFRLSMLWMEDS